MAYERLVIEWCCFCGGLGIILENHSIILLIDSWGLVVYILLHCCLSVFRGCVEEHIEIGW